MATPDTFPSIPFAEAVAALKHRGIKLEPSEHWASVWQQTHHTAFTVARSAGFDILGDIHSELVRVLKEGRTFREFAKDLTPFLQKKGWWGTIPGVNPETGEVREVQLGSTRRLRTIYDVNLRVSQAQGNWERQQAQKATRPYLRYVGIIDGRIRPEHRIWHGRILPVDHAWWKTHYPPNGWRCRCTVMSLSEDDLEDFDFTVSPEPPDDGIVPWRNPATGETIDVPRGIDPGWAYNPGAVDQAARTAKLAMDKLAALPPAIGAEAGAGLRHVTADVMRDFVAWVDATAKEMQQERPRITNERRVLGTVGRGVQAWLSNKVAVELQSAAITMDQGDIAHFLREAKLARGNAVPVADLHRLPELLGNPDAVYWDKGFNEKDASQQKREPGLIYVWKTEDRGAGKLIIRVNYKTQIHIPGQKGRPKIITNSVASGRVDINPAVNLTESEGYIEIKETP